MTDEQKFREHVQRFRIKPIEEKQRSIEALEAKLAEARRDKAELVSQLRAVFDASLVTGIDITALVAPFLLDDSTLKRVERGKAKKAPQKGDRPGRGITDKWKRILSKVVEGYPNHFNASEIQRMAAAIGIQVKAQTMRAQLQAYFSGTYLERDSDGRYRATSVLARELGM